MIEMLGEAARAAPVGPVVERRSENDTIARGKRKLEQPNRNLQRVESGKVRVDNPNSGPATGSARRNAGRSVGCFNTAGTQPPYPIESPIHAAAK